MSERTTLLMIEPRRWRFETPEMTRQVRRTDEWIHRRAKWLSPLWTLARWPLMVASNLGYWIAAPLVFPGIMANVGALFASRPPGLAYWMYFYSVMVILALVTLAMLVSALGRLARRVIDADNLLGGAFFAFGIVVAVTHFGP